jgi:plasmid stabilization system protein ParE
MKHEVLFAPEAETQAQIAAGWWKTNRPSAPQLFEQEVAAAVERLATAPDAGIAFDVESGSFRRLVMSRTAFHLYYEVDESTHQVWVVSIWGAKRGRRPRLD